MKLDKTQSTQQLKSHLNGHHHRTQSETDQLEGQLTFLKRKSTLTSESKDLLQRLNLLKRDMQKNITTENTEN